MKLLYYIGYPWRQPEAKCGFEALLPYIYLSAAHISIRDDVCDKK